jgi:hypothetical protein
MLEPNVVHMVQLFVTPKQLRRWADLAKKKLKNAKGGDDLTIESVFGKNCLINVIADQTEKKK